MWNRRYRWIRRFATGLALAAIVAPAAQARVELGGGGSDAQAKAAGYAALLQAYGYGQDSAVIAPDDRATRVVPQSPDASIAPDDRATRVVSQPTGENDGVIAPDDRATRVVPEPTGGALVLRRNPGAGQRVSQPTVTVRSTDGFNWGDAGIGAGAALGLMLLGLGAGRMTRNAARGATVGA